MEVFWLGGEKNHSSANLLFHVLGCAKLPKRKFKYLSILENKESLIPYTSSE